MQLNKLAFADTHSFNKFFLDYIQGHNALKTFYHRFPTTDQFKAQIDDKSKSFSAAQRRTLVDVLQKQYASITTAAEVTNNIVSICNHNTFTITTGHQLNVFTGPLYFIYKIITVINACKKLKVEYPAFNFVPVYWMASEDHDYEEIKSFRLHGKKFTWETEQQGAVGRFSTEGLAALSRELPGDAKIFTTAYSTQKTLADAVRHYVNALFEKDGLVVIDADDKQLKSSFKEVIRQDVLQQACKPIVDKSTKALEDLGYKAQIHCREINFFYMEKNLRSRLEEKDDKFHVVDTTIEFSREQITQMIEDHPERFSPNVILRPLYQEIILPNLAYAGGPAEVIYWLQLGGVFNHFKIPLPILMPRNFAMVIDPVVQRKLDKTELEIKDFFHEKNFLYNHWVLKHSPRSLTIGDERAQMIELFKIIAQRGGAIDKTLPGLVNAEENKVLKSIEKIERKFLRAEKRLHTDRLRQIEAVKDSLFPNGNLQERTDNFLNFHNVYPDFLKDLSRHIDPFDFQFNVLSL